MNFHDIRSVGPLLALIGGIVIAGCQAPVVERNQISGGLSQNSVSRSVLNEVTANGRSVPASLLEHPISGPIEGISTGCAHCDQHASLVCETPQSGVYRPRDEYLCDGGDKFPRSRVNRKGELAGLELEDTVGQYETMGGKHETVASTRACLYAPRFAAVRRVTNLTVNETHETPLRSEDRLAVNGQQRNLPANNVNQPVATVRNVRNLRPGAIEDGNRGRTVDDVDQLRAFRLKLLPFENLRIVRSGTYHSGEQVRLAQASFAAQTWTETAAVQVTYNGLEPATLARTRGPQEIYEFGPPEGNPLLRVVKIASTDNAQTGDVVHFTIRFDNTGNEPLQTVTLSDNLTTRLEYVAESQECSLDAKFTTQENVGQSLLLRWELAEPLKVGAGGIIRFQCRVR